MEFLKASYPLGKRRLKRWSLMITFGKHWSNSFISQTRKLRSRALKSRLVTFLVSSRARSGAQISWPVSVGSLSTPSCLKSSWWIGSGRSSEHNIVWANDSDHWSTRSNLGMGLLNTVVSKLAYTYDPFGELLKIPMSRWHPRAIKWEHRRWDLGTTIFKSSPGDSDVRPIRETLPLHFPQ